MIEGRTMLLTGATGSFGSAFIRYLIDNKIKPQHLYALSRDWLKQKELRESLGNLDWITWIVGDVRDREKVLSLPHAYNIIHAAAIKDLPTCEDNSFECVKTNILGTMNIIEYADKCKRIFGVKAVLISTDKAVNPINTYGTSKKMTEKLWISRGYNVARYGNVIGSAGSVLPLYRKLIKEGAKSLPVTAERMTRFWFPMKQAIELVIDALDYPMCGELFIPKMPSVRIIDLCEALNMPYHVVGIRLGEKLHEDMKPYDPISGDKGYNSFDNDYLSVDEIRSSIDGI